MTARRLEVRPGGGEDLDSGAISPEAWERWNARAVWCALTDLSTHGRELRLAVLADGEERLVLPAPSAPAWLDGETPAAAPPGVRVTMGRGDELMREEIRLELEGGWLSGRRYAIEDEPMVALDDFSMEDLLLDPSALLALTAAPD